MWPLVGIPQAILRWRGCANAQGMAAYRSVFCRDAGFEHVSRYVSGLLLSANKTLQGIYSQWVFPPGAAVSRRAMHEAVFEAGWNRERLMAQHRATVSQQHQGQGAEVISIDWTFAPHERSEQIYGVKRSYDEDTQGVPLVNSLIERCKPYSAVAILKSPFEISEPGVMAGKATRVMPVSMSCVVPIT